MADLIQATDDILGKLKAAWDAGAQAAAVASEKPVLVYEALATDKRPKPAETKPWGRVTVRHISGKDAAIGRGGIGQKKRFRRTGVVTVECFAPLRDGAGWTASRRLAMLAQGVYQGKGTVNGVTFSEVTLTENGQDGAFYLTTIIGRFSWDEFAA